ncbi:hypothetical protein ACOSQ4_013883 [Xanthoceras sorbifolium]
MEMRTKTNVEFRNEVHEILAGHESRFDQILTELQALRLQQNQNITDNRSISEKELNPFSIGETSYSRPSHTNLDRNQTHLKLNFPTYRGDNPTGWIFKAEQYFEFKNINSQQQVQLASFHLEEVALQWYWWYTKFRGPLSWNEFTKAILHRFGPTDYDDPSEALSWLKQTSTVNAYQEAFEKLSYKVDGLSKNFLVGSFIAGLKDDVRLDVRVKQPKTLSDTISVAHLIEERNQLQRKAVLEISFHALVGTTYPQTFKVIGKVGNREMTILIGGSTHNFIDQTVVMKFGLPVVCDKVF